MGQLQVFPFSFPLPQNKYFMETTILFAVSVLMSLLVWSRIGKRYLWRQITDGGWEKSVRPILLLHAFRFAGLSFLVPGVVHPGLNPAWAIPAAFGDFTAAILAIITLLCMGRSSFKPLLWIFNVLGLFDLLLAFVDGPRYGVVPFLGATYFIVIIYVPLLLLTHFMVFKRLLFDHKVAPVAIL